MDKNKRFINVLILLGILFFTTVVQSEVFRIDDIRVEGLQRIAVGTVFNYLPVRPGDTVDESVTPDIIRALFKTGFFKNVRLERTGGVLIVYVEERPAISEITFSGNNSIESDDLKEGLKESGLATGKTFNSSVLDDIENLLRRQFFNQGKYGVQLTSTVTPLERNRVAINIEILEGQTAKIKKINIIGNDSFEEEELLKKFKLTTGNWLSFYFNDDQYSRQKLTADLETIRSWYLDKGYVNFKIDSTQVTITPDKNEIYITINIVEGEIFTISDIKLAGKMVVEPEEFFPLIHLKRGEAFSRRNVIGSTERISSKLANLGYSFANVNNIPEVDEENKTVSVTFFVDPGQRVYVRRVEIEGNRTTRDSVIRREFRQQEKSWFSSEKLALSKKRVQRLGYFESVNVETPAVPGTTDQVDVKVKVTEKSTGALLIGAGFSQSDGIVFNTSVNQDNFLGSGKRVGFAFNNSSSNTEYKVSYTNPYYSIDGISRGFTLRYKETDYEDLDVADYSTDVGEVSVRYGIPLSEFNRFNVSAGYEYTRFKVGEAPSDEIKEFVANEGDQFNDFKLQLSWNHDSRDSAIFPHDGGIQRLRMESTLPFSDLKYYKLSYSQRRYIPLSQSLTLSSGIDMGYGDAYGGTSKLPFYENFFAGGYKTVRGFKSSSLGPRDSQDDYLGGNVKLVGSVELLFPPPIYSDTKTVRMSTFFDVGNVFDDTVDFGDLRYSVGIGASWLSPLGALTISAAYPVNEQDGDDTEFFQFNLGQNF